MFDFDNKALGREDSSDATKGQCQEKKIKEGFAVLNNILYYLYTDHIIFGTNMETIISPKVPELCPIEDIYIAADRMLLPELKQKALKFLKLSCTPENITSRVMSKFSEVHEEVGKAYAEYFRRNWDRIKGRKEFSDLFKESEDFDECMRINAKFRELMKDAIFLDSN